MGECKSCSESFIKENVIDAKKTKDGKIIFLINTPTKAKRTCKSAGIDIPEIKK
jgi:hypothetical protein